jgi:hypothetical protein
MNRLVRVLFFILVAVPLCCRAQEQSRDEKTPVIKGGAGPCSIEFTVVGADGKRAYAASVKVHIAYGFGGFHKLDLEAGTNSDGKVIFTELPRRVNRPPLEFHAVKDDFEGVARYDPSLECQATQQISLAKTKGQDGR